jgi:hypothetical protein
MTVSEQIIQVLTYLGEKFGIAIDWTSENVIPYITMLCTKLISYEIWTSVAWMGIMGLLIIASVIATRRLVPVFKKGIESQGRFDCDWTIGSGFAIAGLVLLYIIALLVIGTQIFDIVKCTTFPEMYVFEYVQGLIKSAK